MDVTLQHHDLGLTWAERQGMGRSAHAVKNGDGVWLIDPYEHPDALAAAAALGPPAGVIQLLDRHNRDCRAIAERLDVPLHRLPVNGVPFTPFTILDNPAWREVALWWPEHQALIVAEAVGTAPLFALGRRVGVHPMLRLIPPRRPLSAYAPQRLLVGHGTTVESGAAAALTEALRHARSDVPKLALAVPAMLRGR